jgi:hypothetical protein
MVCDNDSICEYVKVTAAADYSLTSLSNSKVTGTNSVFPRVSANSLYCFTVSGYCTNTYPFEQSGWAILSWNAEIIACCLFSDILRCSALHSSREHCSSLASCSSLSNAHNGFTTGNCNFRATNSAQAIVSNSGGPCCDVDSSSQSVDYILITYQTNYN